MRVVSLLAVCALASSVAARSLKHVGRELPDLPNLRTRAKRAPEYPILPREIESEKRQAAPIVQQTAETAKFKVDGSAGAIPNVTFDIGESYAGLLPISSTPNASELYFWFFPTTNPEGSEDLTIWLNGGPGCSSLEGFLQENGPFLWQYGTFQPIQNPWTWINLTNMVWVEQPVGTGFSQGTPIATNEETVAEQFLGFWKNFIDTFGLHGKKIWITGESYAGYYVPYITDAMQSKNDTKYFGAEGSMFYDPVITGGNIQTDVVAVAFEEYHDQLFILNSSYRADLVSRADKCGYTDYMNTYLTFPPPGLLPDEATPKGNVSSSECAVFDDIFNAVLLTNPCFDIYQVATTCPILWDVLGFPGSIEYLPEGATIYFNRTDVQKAINAPIQPWAECSNGVLDSDTSLPSSIEVIPRIVENSKRTIIAHGLLDMVLIANGTLLGIQNMTWGGKQGFQIVPKDPLYIPYHEEISLSTLAASGVMGVTHTERGLTWNEVSLSGHMIPQYQPSVAYRQMEFLLGRISSLSEVSDFTTQKGNFGNNPNATFALRDRSSIREL
ncbi:alpha/beta-hydrolase [Aulographum hederae CBS 113979]|uniref:Carboxypeptidase n=1 Tax=Aulographum hederae CBS 113979 TaxID=1176131 RepID=A0A6G1H8I6_9PEZI|nr:alpha/beta-hydrolase [Aulographum hederae CBS 113979]